jgi:hypothetical protein
MFIRDFLYIEFLTLNAQGSKSDMYFANLYAGAFCQFTRGIMGASDLCTFIRLIIIGGVGFKCKYCHLYSFVVVRLLLFVVSFSSIRLE